MIMRDEDIKDALGRALDEVIPKNLDDIIRKRRDRFELGLATDDEVRAITGEILYSPDVKDTIDDWRMVAMRDKRTGEVQVILLGHSQKENVAWVTSSLVVVDRARNQVVTKSDSLYGLGSRGQGEPPNLQLIHLCATLHYWGSGPMLGVPAFFY